MNAREQLQSFTLDTLPTLDTVVLGALELFSAETVPTLELGLERPLVMGSGNAAATGKILFATNPAIFADEATYSSALAQGGYDGVVVLSASGKKHAIAMVQEACEHQVPVHLITNNDKAPAAQMLADTSIHVFPKNREPYTYNTSTYLGPIFGASKESAGELRTFIEQQVSPTLLRNFADYNAYTFIVPDAFAPVCDMVRTKFDELFGGMVTGRVFTESEIMHAKTVVPSGAELFISLGCRNEHYGLPRNHLMVPMPESAGFAAAIAISYFIVGKIQMAHPPYFTNNIVTYCETATQLFGHDISPIVE